MNYSLNYFKKDFAASLVVFFIALPLCLGIALASGAPLFSGIIAGIIGGVVVGSLSGSALGVSGPAAGLVTIVTAYLAILSGSWQAFLLVVMLSGFVQLACGYLKLGSIAYYFPSSVINGMLAGIGLLIMIKQIPYLTGHQINIDWSSNIISELRALFTNVNLSIITISIISILILVSWETKFLKNKKFTKLLHAPVVVVVLGIIFFVISSNFSFLSLTEKEMVRIPVVSNMSEFFGQFILPDFSQLTNPQIYAMALVVALVASIETLLCAEATDKLDPKRRVTSVNRELKAQGVGNIISGLIGGLPITQVIVRSSANITFGAATKFSAIFHGILLLISAILIPNILNMIPLVSLACILTIVGYKLAKPAVFKKIYNLGHEQFIPFIITVFSIVFLDLLKGIGIGMMCAIGYIIYNHLKNSYHKVVDDERKGMHIIKLAEEISFLNKGGILQMLKDIPDGSNVLIDGTNLKYIHHDVLEVIQDFKINSSLKKISLETKGINLESK
jgi:SulP family sulfate permease